MSHTSPRVSSRFRGAAHASVLPLLFAGACASGDPRDLQGTDQSLQGAEWSYVSDTVVSALSAASSMEGRTWNVSRDNRFEPGFVIQTPVEAIWGRDVQELNVPAVCKSDCDADFGRERCSVQSDCDGGGLCRELASTVTADGGAPRKLCLGHSDALADQVYGLITSATRIVDVTSLTPPDGLYRAAVRNAITRLSKRAKPPQVRLLFGTFPVQGVVNTTTLLKDLVRDVPKSSKIDVSVGAYRSSDVPPSWNHAKMVAVDGRDALVGGHNLWGQHYLQLDPVHDTSLRIRGSAAGAAQRFANELWSYTCTHMTWTTWLTWSVWSNQLKDGKVITGCPRPYDLPISEGPESTTVIAVGRLGTGIASNGNQSDVALRALMRSAQKTLRLSLQDFGPPRVVGISLGAWPEAYIAELAAAIQRGVHVHMVLSNVNAAAGGLSPIEAQYANGWTPTDVGKQLRAYMEQHAGFLRGDELRAQLCKQLHLAPFRYSASNAWPDGVPFANHDKVVIADEQGFYVGSQNLYPADLQEFGYIVDDSRVTADFVAQHWANVWGQAAPVAVSGEGAARCEL